MDQIWIVPSVQTTFREAEVLFFHPDSFVMAFHCAIVPVNVTVVKL